MYCDACDRSTPAQPLSAGAVALSRARSTNPEIFCRGWKSAGPPDPELPPDMDDSSGVNATVRLLHFDSVLALVIVTTVSLSIAILFNALVYDDDDDAGYPAALERI